MPQEKATQMGLGIPFCGCTPSTILKFPSKLDATYTETNLLVIFQFLGYLSGLIPLSTNQRIWKAYPHGHPQPASGQRGSQLIVEAVGVSSFGLQKAAPTWVGLVVVTTFCLALAWASAWVAQVTTQTVWNAYCTEG